MSELWEKFQDNDNWVEIPEDEDSEGKSDAWFHYEYLYEEPRKGVTESREEDGK